MNVISAIECLQCTLPFSNLPPSAFVTTQPPVYYTPQQVYAPPPPVWAGQADLNTETGRKTFMWYRIYMGVIAAVYLLVAVMGMLMMTLPAEEFEARPEDNFIVGIIYAIIGAIFFFIHIIALALPAKPYNWIVGIIMIALGMTSCCTWPAAIPLLIFWLKPETKQFFGRN